MSAHAELLSAVWHSTPRTHAYGFAQTYLSDNVRLHLFNDAISEVSALPEQVPVRHNHRYDFESYVLKGVVIDEPCDFMLRHPDWFNNFGLGNAYRRYECRPAHEGSADIAATSDMGEIVERLPRVSKVGAVYSMKADEYHRTTAVGETLTLFKRTNVVDRWNSLIAPHSFVVEHSLTKQVPPAWLRDHFLRVILNDITEDQASIVMRML